jgi:DNA modification methylase
MNKVYWGDCRDSLRQMAKEGIQVQTCITSPPYFGLRDYGTGNWVGGDSNCSHKRDSKYSDKTITGHANKELTVGDAIYKSVCPKCGAIREDKQLGLEESPEKYVKAMVEVFACVWDVLADDGTLWVNIGDSYSGSGKGVAGNLGKKHDERNMEGKHSKIIPEGLKPKDLIGIPWRLAFALQDFGWYLRQDIIWHKPNPMPESVKDRCTKSHEYIFLLTKKPNYYFDYESIKEEGVIPEGTKGAKGSEERQNQSGVNARPPEYKIYDGMRNKRDVWTVNTKPYSGSHFAVFPTKLVEPMVLAGSRVGDIVLDPFFGSGTTGSVAQKLGRRWIGCELNKDYENLQNERLNQQSFIL